MTEDFRARLPWLASLLLAVLLLLAPVLPAQAAGFYIDNKLGEVAAADRAVVANPKPVQLLFQFTTDGVANAKAAKYLKKQVFDLVRASEAFSEVSETPVAGGAMLVVVIDNITEKGAAKKGFTAGLTFGLAGTIVVDNYRITAEYTQGGEAPPIKAEVQHALYIRIGKKDDPPNTIRMKNANEAITAVVRQGIGHAVNRMALEPAFGGVRAGAAAPAAPAAGLVPATESVPTPPGQPAPQG